MPIPSAPALIGESPQVRQLADLIPKLARTKFPVLLLGESGTGKDVVARALYDANPEGAFVPIDCTALASSVFESELFGHVKGAFTGAYTANTGLIEMAHGGTAFFDEIGDVPLELQVKLLRLLQRKEYRPVGSPVMRHADFRVIAATNRELADMVERGAFRRDLYYRLKVVTLRIPPLRDRKVDIEPLATHFLAALGPQYRLRPDVLEQFLAYDWPGNVRELEHCIAAMVALSSSAELDSTVLPSGLKNTSNARQYSTQDVPNAVPVASCKWRERSAIPPLAEVEKQHIAQVLEFTQWDCAAAARILRIGRTTLYRRIRECGLERVKAHSASSGSA